MEKPNTVALPSEVLDLLLIFDRRLTRLECAIGISEPAEDKIKSKGNPRATKDENQSNLTIKKATALRTKATHNEIDRNTDSRPVQFDLKGTTTTTFLRGPPANKVSYTKRELTNLKTKKQDNKVDVEKPRRLHQADKGVHDEAHASPDTSIGSDFSGSARIRIDDFSPRKSKCLYGLVVDEDSDDDKR